MSLMSGMVRFSSSERIVEGNDSRPVDIITRRRTCIWHSADYAARYIAIKGEEASKLSPFAHVFVTLTHIAKTPS